MVTEVEGLWDQCTAVVPERKGAPTYGIRSMKGFGELSMEVIMFLESVSTGVDDLHISGNLKRQGARQG